MNRKEYKKSMSGIHPSEQVVERIMDMTNEKRENRGLTFKRLASVALAMAILVAGGFGISTHNKNSNKKYVSPSGYSIGGIMTVEANTELKGGTNKDSSHDLGYRIYKKDITGLSQKEIEEARVYLAKLWLCSGDESHIGEYTDEYTLNDAIKNNVYINNNIMYAFEGGNVESALTVCGIVDPTTVKEIRVSNTNEYGYPIIEAEDLYYTEESDGTFIRDESTVDTSKTSIQGHDISFSGDRYLQCRRIADPNAKLYHKDSFDKNSPIYGLQLQSEPNTFYIDYRPADEFFTMLGNNPNYDLTQYNDTMTITVEFNDGKIAENKIVVSFDADGNCYCKLKSYTFK